MGQLKAPPKNKLCPGCGAMKIVDELEAKTKLIIDVGLVAARKQTAMECLEIFDEYFRRAGYKAGSEFVRSEFIKKFGLEI